MDERTDNEEFYPGDRKGAVPRPELADKVDRVNLGEVGESYTLKDVKNKVNQIVRVIAPAAVCLALAVVRLMSHAATAPLEDIPNTAPVVTNEEDAVAMAAVGALGAAVSNRVEAAEGSLQAEIAGATNAVVQAALRAAEAESNRVESTYAKKGEIPAAPDLAPYALKSELPTNYITEGDIANFATRAWIASQGYATEAGVGARIEAQNVAISGATNAQNAAIGKATNALAGAIGEATQRIEQVDALWRAGDRQLRQRIEEIEVVAADSNAVTRLVTPDGTTWQDATGCVWRVEQRLVGDLYMAEDREFENKSGPIGFDEDRYVVQNGSGYEIWLNDYGEMEGYQMSQLSGHEGWWKEERSYGTYFLNPSYEAVTTLVTRVVYTNEMPAAGAPEAPEVTAKLRWRADGTACVVSVEASGTLEADQSTWTEGQAVLAVITLAEGASVASDVDLVGYGSWPTGTPFVACCYRIGMKVYVVPSIGL